MSDRNVNIVYNEIPITIGFKADVYQQADGRGGTLEGYTVEINPDGINTVHLSINHVADLDNLIDQLLEHRKIITDHEKK